MADVASTVTVDGVEPSILVKLLDVAENPHSIKVFTTTLYKDADPVLVTPEDINVLGSYAIEIINDEDNKTSTETPAEKAVGINPVQPTQAQNPPVVAVSIPGNQ